MQAAADCRSHQESAYPLGKLRGQQTHQFELQAPLPAPRIGPLRDGSRAVPPRRAKSFASVLDKCARARKRSECEASADARCLEACSDLGAAAFATRTIAIADALTRPTRIEAIGALEWHRRRKFARSAVRSHPVFDLRELGTPLAEKQCMPGVACAGRFVLGGLANRRWLTWIRALSIPKAYIA